MTVKAAMAMMQELIKTLEGADEKGWEVKNCDLKEGTLTGEIRPAIWLDFCVVKRRKGSDDHQ